MDPVSVFGLAASVLQLGTFVFASMGTLKKIRDGLKTGNADLRRIQQSISDHQRTLEWLRIICSKTPVQTSAEEELLDQLQASIKQSEYSVVEFSNVIKKIQSPTILKGKRLRVAEPAIRLMFRREEVQKYNDILDSQIVLFSIFLIQLSRLESSSASAEIQSLVRNGFEKLLPQVSDVTSSLERLERLLRPVNSWEIPSAADSSLKIHESQTPWTSPSHGSSTLSGHKYLRYETIFGSITVVYHSQTNNYREKHEKRNGPNCRTKNKYYFCFRPSGWVSRYVIELGIKWLQSDGSIKLITVTPVCYRLCTDLEVIRALGLAVCKACITRTRDSCTCCKEKYPPPDPEAVRRYLDYGIMSASDSLYDGRHGTASRLPILDRVISTLEYTNCRWLRECHEICRLLLEHGAEANRRCLDWSGRAQQIFLSEAVEEGETMTETLRNSWRHHSIGRLLLTYNPGVATSGFDKVFYICPPYSVGHTGRYAPGCSRLCNLIQLPNSVPFIRAECMDIDIFDERFTSERYILTFLGNFRSDLKALMGEYTMIWSTKSQEYFSTERMFQEINADPSCVAVKALVHTIILLGTREMIVFFRANVPRFSDWGSFFSQATKSNDPELFYEILPWIDTINNPLCFLNGILEKVVSERFSDLEFRETYCSKARLEDTKKQSEPSMCLQLALQFYVDKTKLETWECYLLTVDALVNRGHASKTDQGFLGVEIRDVVILSTSYSIWCTDTDIIDQLVRRPNVFLELEVERKCGPVEADCSGPFGYEFIRKAYIGFTPLMVALDTGQLETVKILVGAGAQMQGLASCGISPMELAHRNVAAKHPRILPTTDCWDGQWSMPQITLKIDEESLKVLEEALQARGELISRNRIEKVHDDEKDVQKISIELGAVLQFLHGSLEWLNNPVVMFDRELCQQIVDKFVLCTVLTLALSFVTALEIRDRLSLKAAVSLFSRPIVVLWIICIIWLWMGSV